MVFVIFGVLKVISLLSDKSYKGFFFVKRGKMIFFKRKRDVLFIGNFFFWNECIFVFFDFILKFELLILWMFGEEVGYV